MSLMGKKGFFKRFWKNVSEFFEEEPDDFMEIKIPQNKDEDNLKNYLIASVFIFLIVVGLLIFFLSIKGICCSQKPEINMTEEYLKDRIMSVSEISDCESFSISSNIKKYILNFNLDNYLIEEVPENETFIELSKSDFGCVDPHSIKADYLFLDASSEKEIKRARFGYEFGTPQDWSEYSDINIIMYNKDPVQYAFLFSLMDDDGDWMMAEDALLLQEEGWLKVTIPIDEFEINTNTPVHGNRKRDFDSIRAYHLMVVEAYADMTETERTIYLNTLYLSK